MSSILTKLKQMLVNDSPMALKKDCPYCGGGRCMGMCGGSLAKLSKVKFEGHIKLHSPEEDVVLVKDQQDFTFKTSDRFGTMLLKRCPEGSYCQIEALVNGQQVEKLISAKKTIEKSE